MADPRHLAILQRGVAAWNIYRRDSPEERPDLSNAELYLANLAGANLSKAFIADAALRGANLSEANLIDVGLVSADLGSANLTGASLVGANLSGANLMSANLSGSNLFGANLHRANLMEANLVGADLESAKLIESNLEEADLTRANLRGAELRGARLGRAKLIEATCVGTDFTQAILIQTNLRHADMTGAHVYGISAWDLEVEGTVQKNLIITPPWYYHPNSTTVTSAITVDDLEVAQFIYLLLTRQKVRDVITTMGEKAVLILGRFTERKDLLEGIAAKLRQYGYLPIIFDFLRPTDRDLTETVKVLAGLSRFVIADITNPHSVPLELQATVPDYAVPFITMLQRGQPAFGMFDDLPRKYHWALPVLEYTNKETLLAAFERKVIAPASEKVQELRHRKGLVPSRRSAED